MAFRNARLHSRTERIRAAGRLGRGVKRLGRVTWKRIFDSAARRGVGEESTRGGFVASGIIRTHMCQATGEACQSWSCAERRTRKYQTAWFALAGLRALEDWSRGTWVLGEPADRDLDCGSTEKRLLP